ncbi:MAG: hypothetical protein KA319_04475 [Ferruginibacter sp.]|nr:hypothetical protein [Ferruginibacter sp.]
MKIVVTIFFIVTILSFSIKDEEFFCNETTCNVTRTIDKKYVLKLREKDRFLITIQINNSRYTKTIKDSISGNYERIDDTLKFKVDYVSEKYLLKNGQSFFYAYKKDSLVGLKIPFALPTSFVRKK